MRRPAALLLIVAACGPDVADVDSVSSSEALRTLSVPSGYATLQAAIDAAAPGDIVQASAGTYREQITIGKDLKLIGAGDNQTIIDAGGGVGVTVAENRYVHLSGLTVRNGTSGVQATGTSTTGALRILECGFEGLERGVWISGRTAIVQRSRFQGNQTGLMLGADARATVANNVLVRGGWGLRLVSSISYLWLRNNVFAWNASEHIAMLDGGMVPSSRHSIGYNDFWQPTTAGGAAANNGFYFGSCSYDDNCVFPNSLTVEPGFVDAKISGGWARAGDMAVDRGFRPPAVTLPDGRVLAAGGISGGASLAGAEVLDPATRAWTATGSLLRARHNHALALLPGGRVLAAGGRNHPDGVNLASAEIWDPSTGRWSAAASMSIPRQLHTATALPDGRVLVAGGFGNPARLDSAEVYDPAQDTWTSVGPMNRARERHRAALLGASGQVLLVGGYDDYGWHFSAELFDPQTNTFAVAPQPQPIGSDFALTPLASGGALATGGLSTGMQVQIYDPRVSGWYLGSPPPVSFDGHASAQVALDGKILVSGSYASTRAFALLDPLVPDASGIVNPAQVGWTEVGRSVYEHPLATAAPLGDRFVAVFGNGRVTEIWDTTAGGSAGPADYHLRADSPLVNAGDPYVLDQDRGRSDVGRYGGRAPQMRSSSISPSKATVTSTVKLSCSFADLIAPQKVEVLLGGSLGTLAAATTDTWPANDATYTASLVNPPLGKYYARCHGVTAEGLDVYYPKLGSYKYFTVDNDLTWVALGSPADGAIVPATQTSLTVDVKTTKSFYGYTVRVYYSKDGVNFSYKTAKSAGHCCGEQPDHEVWRVTLTRGTHFGPGTLYLYAYGRDGNGPTLYDKNGGAFYRVTVQ